MTPDPVDRAAEQSQAQLDAHLRDQAAAAAVTEAPLVRDGVRLYVDCEDPILTARLAHAPHAVRCVECQQDHERKQKQFARTR